MGEVIFFDIKIKLHPNKFKRIQKMNHKYKFQNQNETINLNLIFKS